MTMYHRGDSGLWIGVSTYATEQDPSWTYPRDVEEYAGATVIDLALARLEADRLPGEQGEFAEPDQALSGLRTAMLQAPNEVGTWSLEYLGPGFHVQLRIARRQRQARVDGWMSPAQPIKVFLSTLLRQPLVLEAQVSESGRFEFPIAPTGACRMSFVTDERGRPPATPPFWI